MLMNRIEIAGSTHPGLIREHNEDTISWNCNEGLILLADGMGGHNAGEVASQMAVDSIALNMKELNTATQIPLSPGFITECIEKSVSASNSDIYRAAEENAEQKGMGTTVVLLQIVDHCAHIAHVGDSRLYCLRNQELTQVTTDHSLIQDLIEKGFYSAEEAKEASISHVVTRALGAAPEVQVDIQQYPVEKGDLLLICSDGLTDIVDDTEIQPILTEFTASLEERVQKLIDAANAAGGNDNISAILVEVLE